MNQGTFFEKPTIEPVTNLIIEESEPLSYELANITFQGILPGDKPETVGFVGGMLNDGDFADFDRIEVYPQWRGRQFGSQLFRHFVSYAKLQNVKTISISAANERTAHLMGTVPDVKNFEFLNGSGELLPNFTIPMAVNLLEEARKKQGLVDEADKYEELKTTVRITANLQ